MPAIAGQAAWNQWIEQARAAEILGVAFSFPSINLKRTGTAEFVGPCPMCGGHDRFSINIKKQICNCRKCDLKGNVIALVQTLTGGGFLDACEYINKSPRPDRSRDETLEDRNARLAANVQRREALQQRQEEQRQVEAAKAKRDEQTIADILDERRAVPIRGTYGEAYLKARGLTPSERLTGDIRFVADLDYWGARDNGTRSIVHLATLPAIVAKIRDFSGGVIGISQTFLDPKEPRKWRPEGSPTNSSKKIRGEKKHGMIRLYTRPSETMAIAEGWENALAWHQMGYGPEDVTLAAAVDLGNLAGGATGSWPHPVLRDADGKPERITNAIPDPQHRGIVLPEGIKNIILLADLDSETYTTAAKLRTAGLRFRSMGINIEISWPAVGKDFNDMLIAQMEEHGDATHASAP